MNKLMLILLLSLSVFAFEKDITNYKVVSSSTDGHGCVDLIDEVVTLDETHLKIGSDLVFPLINFDRGVDEYWCTGSTSIIDNGFRFEVRGMCNKYDIKFTKTEGLEYNLDISILKYQNTCKYKLKLLKL